MIDRRKVLHPLGNCVVFIAAFTGNAHSSTQHVATRTSRFLSTVSVTHGGAVCNTRLFALGLGPGLQIPFFRAHLADLLVPNASMKVIRWLQASKMRSHAVARQLKVCLCSVHMNIAFYWRWRSCVLLVEQLNAWLEIERMNLTLHWPIWAPVSSTGSWEAHSPASTMPASNRTRFMKGEHLQSKINAMFTGRLLI